MNDDGCSQASIMFEQTDNLEMQFFGNWPEIQIDEIWWFPKLEPYGSMNDDSRWISL